MLRPFFVWIEHFLMRDFSMAFWIELVKGKLTFQFFSLLKIFQVFVECNQLNKCCHKLFYSLRVELGQGMNFGLFLKPEICRTFQIMKLWPSSMIYSRAVYSSICHSYQDLTWNEIFRNRFFQIRKPQTKLHSVKKTKKIQFVYLTTYSARMIVC